MANTPHKWNYNFPQIAREYGLNLSGAESGIIDWRFIATYDLEKLIRENDFERLEAAIPHLSEAPLGTILNTSVLDSGISKYFCLAQLGLQYLSFCKDFLDKAVTSLRRNVYNMEKEKQNLMKTYRKQNEELLRMHKKVQKVEMHLEKRGYHCTKCPKYFESPELLNTHVQIKHPDYMQNVVSDNNLLSNIKLELEIKLLKEKLNEAEFDLQEYRKKSQKAISYSFGIQTNFEEEKEKDDTVEIQSNRQMLLDSQHQLADLLKAQISALDEWKVSEKERYQRETEEIKCSLQETINYISQRKRIVLHKTKLDLYSIPAENAQENKNSTKTLNSEWERKFHDLEVNYKNSYEKMSYILSNLDKKNKDQLLLIEDLKKKPDTRDSSVQVNLNTKTKNIFEDKISNLPSLSKILPISENPSINSNTDSDTRINQHSKYKVIDCFQKSTVNESIKVIPHDKVTKKTKTRILNKLKSILHEVGVQPNHLGIKTEEYEKIKSQFDIDRFQKSRKYKILRDNIIQSIESDMQNFDEDHHRDLLYDELFQKINFEKSNSSTIDKKERNNKAFNKNNQNLENVKSKISQKRVNFYCNKTDENDDISVLDLGITKSMYNTSSDTE